MARPAPIWETAPPVTSVGQWMVMSPAADRGLTFVGDRSAAVAHLAAHLREEIPLGGGEGLRTPRPDLVEDAVGLHPRPTAGRAAQLQRSIAYARDTSRVG